MQCTLRHYEANTWKLSDHFVTFCHGSFCAMSPCALVCNGPMHHTPLQWCAIMHCAQTNGVQWCTVPFPDKGVWCKKSAAAASIGGLTSKLMIKAGGLNIAKGTTDPGYRVYNLGYLSSYIEFHLHWFQIWPIVCGSTCISSKFDHQVMPPESVPNLANM